MFNEKVILAAGKFNTNQLATLSRDHREIYVHALVIIASCEQDKNYNENHIFDFCQVKLISMSLATERFLQWRHGILSFASAGRI